MVLVSFITEVNRTNHGRLGFLEKNKGFIQ